MGIRDIIREKIDSFHSAQASSTASRLSELRKERIKEEGRAKIYATEKKEKERIAKARAKRKELVNEKRFGGLKKTLAKVKEHSKTIKNNKSVSDSPWSKDTDNPWR